MICTGEATLASFKNGGNGRHQSSDTNNDEAVVPNNGNGYETRHGTVHRNNAWSLDYTFKLVTTSEVHVRSCSFHLNDVCFVTNNNDTL